MSAKQQSYQFGTTEYFLLQGDITEQATEIIVNAANASLLGGGGVDGAIHRKGGPDILNECREIRKTQGSCSPGNAVITTGGALLAEKVIHTVGPIWKGGHRGEADVLGQCYRNCLRIAREVGSTEIVFPSISTGAYRFPIDKAALIAQREVIQEVSKDDFFSRVGFVLFDDRAFEAYQLKFNLLISEDK